MSREQIVAWAIGKGWELTSHGHLVKRSERGTLMRLKFQRYSVRLERSWRDSFNRLKWTRQQSGFLSRLRIDENDRLCGLVR